MRKIFVVAVLFAVLVPTLGRADAPAFDEARTSFKGEQTGGASADVASATLQTSTHLENHPTFLDEMRLFGPSEEEMRESQQTASLVKWIEMDVEPNSDYDVYVSLQIPTSGENAPKAVVTEGDHPLKPVREPLWGENDMSYAASRLKIDGSFRVCPSTDCDGAGSGGGRRWGLVCQPHITGTQFWPDPDAPCENPGELTLREHFTAYPSALHVFLEVRVDLESYCALDPRDLVAESSAYARVTDITVSKSV